MAASRLEVCGHAIDAAIKVSRITFEAVFIVVTPIINSKT
jgi:hypothetical protein